MRRSAFILLPLILVPASGCGSTAQGQSGSPRDGAAASGAIHALARLEPASGLITVGARPGSRIESVLVRQDDKVEAGQLLAVLEGNAQAKAQLAVAEAAKAKAEHQRAAEKRRLALEREREDAEQKVRGGMAPRLLASQAIFDDLSNQFKQLQSTLQGREKFDLTRGYLETEARFLRDSIEVRSLQATQGLIKNKRALEDQQLDGPSPDLVLLDRQIDLARAGLAMTEVHAPSAGRVLEIVARPGELSSGPLLLMGDLSAMSATAEVFQSDIPRLKVGDAATVRVLDRPTAGKVSRIGSVVARNLINPVDPRALQDRRVIKVQVALDDPAFAARFVNMEVEVSIRPGDAIAGAGASMPERKPGS
ncbi:HlyD family efflux transporter periplasmic adaptor subunit [Aquisphaera giovannonii]|nr:HlyD family efflux transporter periplasmic adaptor subunit [Aquisphaera giovannonii]